MSKKKAPQHIVCLNNVLKLSQCLVLRLIWGWMWFNVLDKELLIFKKMNSIQPSSVMKIIPTNISSVPSPRYRISVSFKISQLRITLKRILLLFTATI